MKRFFVYELKKSLFVICALSIAVTAIYVVILISNADRWGHDLYLAEISVMGGLLAVAVPIWKLYYKMKKRSVDLYYALPLSHCRVLAVKFLVGMLAVFVPYTLAYWVGAFMVMGMSTVAFNAVWYVPIYFGSLIPIYILYAISSFLYTRANKAIDGAVTIFAVGFAAATFATVLQSVITNISGAPLLIDGLYDRYELYVGNYYLPFLPLDLLISNLQPRFNMMFITVIRYAPAQKVHMAIGCSLVTLCAAAATVMLFVTEKRAKAENVEQITESLFGYKTMIPFYSFSSAYLVTADSLILAALIAAATYAVSVLYKRTPKIGYVAAITASVAFILGAALSFLVEM